MPDTCRIDKWLWAVRLCKTRTVAANFVSAGKIKVNGESVKASYSISAGKFITFRKGLVTYKYKVLGILDKRASAPIAAGCYEDITSEEELMKLKVNEHFPTAFREKGTGRPTKKDRRDIDEWMNF